MQSLKDPLSADRAVVGVTVESGKITDVVVSYGKKNTGT
jgi:major membrane immunogen (membrane-anchored lipoprotein)